MFFIIILVDLSMYKLFYKEHFFELSLSVG